MTSGYMNKIYFDLITADKSVFLQSHSSLPVTKTHICQLDKIYVTPYQRLHRKKRLHREKKKKKRQEKKIRNPSVTQL